MSIEVTKSTQPFCDNSKCPCRDNLLDIEIGDIGLIITLCDDCIDELMEKLRKAR